MLLRAFAKINLELRILGKRPDGFHELRTIFQAIDWFDEIEIEPAAAFAFEATAGPRGETNLVVRAVRAYESVLGRQVNVRIRLKKNVPSGAGLGGGSSDAAVTIAALERIYGKAIGDDARERRDFLRSLGSDVGFFGVGGRALGAGRGDEIEPLQDETDYWLALVNPGFAVATAEAYSWLTLPDITHSIEGFRAPFVPGSERAERTNDFEKPVFARHPQLKDIRDDLLRRGAFRAALSGSGAVVFGQFRAEQDARQAAGALNRRFSVKVAKPLSRSEYFRRMVE